MDRKFVILAFVFAILGLCLGIYMAASKNHGQFVTHAHIMLVGFLLSFIYGLCHKLWLGRVHDALSRWQFYLHIGGALVISVGLFLLYGNFVALEVLDPLLALASLAVLIGAVLMLVLFLKSAKHH